MRAKFVYGNILNELSENSTLYHRSMKKMKVGEKINPKLDKSKTHWLENKPFEIAMELFRQEHYPEKPKRINSIFCSIIPRSRFKDKGYLYAVKPRGKMFMTDSRIIDDIEQRFVSDYCVYLDRHFGSYEEGQKYMKEHPKDLLHILDYLGAKHYWNGVNIGDKEGTEVLCESVVVTEILGVKKEDLLKNDVIEITEDNKIFVETIFYFEKEDLEKYKKKDIKIINFINKIKSLYTKPEEKLSEYNFGEGGGNLRINGYIKKGTKLKVLYAQSSMDKRKTQDEDDYQRREHYKYSRIGFSLFNITQKVLKFKMEYWSLYTKGIRDISKYFKKI